MESSFSARSVRRALALPALLLTLGCSGALPGHQDPDLAEDIQKLQQRVLELQQQATVNEVELARLRLRVAELEQQAGGTVRAAVRPAPKPPAPLRPQPEAPPYRAPEIEEDDLDAEPYAPPPAATTAGSQELYDQAYTLYHEGRYVDSESAFRRFLQSYGDSDLADNAQYWIGECRYARKDFQGALAAFVETVERYPDGNKVPAALLKAGQSLEALGDREAARETYQQLVDRFPLSDEVPAARERMGKLR